MITQTQIKRIQQVRSSLTEFYDKALEKFGEDHVITDLMAYRGYTNYAMYETLFEAGVFKIEDFYDLTTSFPEYTLQQFKDWGLVNDKGNYILSNRYTTAIRDIEGTVIALVGWHPKGGARKYVTTPTLGFSRDTSFFNLDHAYKLAWSKFNGRVFMVEGIYDALALRSLGLPAIAVQGLELSNIKSIMLSRFSKVIAIPDNDNAGRSVNPYTNELTKKTKKSVWRIPIPHVFILLPDGVKDTDDLSMTENAYERLTSILERMHLCHL